MAEAYTIPTAKLRAEYTNTRQPTLVSFHVIADGRTIAVLPPDEVKNIRMSPHPQTMLVKAWHPEQGECVSIFASDFDAKIHEPYEPVAKAEAEPDEPTKPVARAEKLHLR